MEGLFENFESELRELGDNLEQLRTEQNGNKELLEVLKQGESFFSVSQAEISSEFSGDSSAPLLQGEGGSSGLNCITGVIPTEKQPQFSLLCYRATRATMHLRYSEIEEPLLDPITGKFVEKSVFIVFFGGSSARKKIEKACETLGASIHEYPEGDALQIRQNLSYSIEDCNQTIIQTEGRRRRILSEIAENIDRWEVHVKKEKAIFHILNLFDHKTSQHSVIAEAWIPTKHTQEVEQRMRRADLSSGAQVATYCETLTTKTIPPTYFDTNFFTDCFQAIVDSYGIARYKEVNPAVLTIVSFPFLFGLMFGDVGHGIILALFALALIIQQDIRKKKSNNEILGMLFNGRWILFLMGLFAIYCGLVYNEWFGFPLKFFPSRFNEVTEHEGDPTMPCVYNGTDERANNPSYLFGVDPLWYEADNKLEFSNSIKKKLSVIFGVLQMIVGLILSLLNHVHFRHWEDIIFEFIPEMIFLCFTFGYLCFMIILKWATNWDDRIGQEPDLLQTMTSFFLSPGSVDSELYSGQSTVQVILLVVAVLSLPVLLLGKPIFEIRKHKKQQGFRPLDNNIVEAEPLAPEEDHEDEEEEEEPFDSTEVIIKQIIHTIEFALNCVSHTASYLRLWALSLAHSQLSEVFWTMTIGLLMGFSSDSSIGKFLDNSGLGVFLGFSVWFAISIGVLLVMESLSAFLHALRLHWVEFQSKFFYGDGKRFMPFSFEKVLSPEDED